MADFGLFHSNKSTLGGILTIVATIFQLVVGISLLGLICYGLFLACNWILDKIYLRGKYQETESLQRNIALFKGYVLAYLLWILSPLWFLLPLTILFGNQFFEGLAGDVTLAVFAFVAFMLYVILLSRIYIVSKKLNEDGFLKTSGFSMLVIAILLTLAFQLGVFILFIVLWVKSNRYLKTQAVPLVEPQISGLLFVTVQGLKMSILSEKRRFRMLHYAKTAHIYAKMAKRI